MTTDGLEDRLREELCRYIPPNEATEGPHGIFRYPAKYLPQIARTLIFELVTVGDRVLDPFAGSGTTLVESGRLGRPCVGLDLNPLAVLLSRVKTTPILAENLVGAAQNVLLRARTFRDEEAPIPDFPNRDYWFPEESLGPLARMREAIRQEERPALRRALLVAFLGIVKDCSNASTYHYKLTRSREPDPVTGKEAYGLYARRVKRNAVAFARRRFDAPAFCLLGNATSPPFPDGSFDAVVTHPPYSISFDFVRVFKIFLWWLNPTQDTVALDREMVGNQRRNTGEPPRTGIGEIDDLTTAVYEQDTRDGLAVAHFFADMDRAILEWRRVLRPDGVLALYMGDSQARWQMLDAPGNLVRLAERAGFKLELRLPREVPEQASSSIRQIHVEEVLILRR